MSYQKVLLTGGLGYIGSHIANLLLDNNYDVVIIDNLNNSSIEKLAVLNKYRSEKSGEIKFYKYDMLNKSEIEDVFIKEKNISLVVHCAGLKSVGESITKPLLYYNTNLNILLNLLEIMEKYDCKNIIFSSSATVYGPNLSPPYFENMDTGLGLTNPYGKSKYIQEIILQDLFISNNSWNIIILRYFNPVGHKTDDFKEIPNGTPNNLFPYILKVHNKELKELKVFGNDYDTKDGTCIRDFIHVEDLAEGHLKACEYMYKNNNGMLKIYNLGTGNGISVKTMIYAFERVNNTKLNYSFAERRIGDLPKSYASSELANTELIWSPKKTLDDMVKI